MWFFLESFPDEQDWTHEASITRMKPVIDETADVWVDIDKVSSNIPNDARVVHVVYHFHDNYSDHSSFFTDRETAEKIFWKYTKEQHTEMRRWNLLGGDEELIYVLQYDDKNGQEKITSTLYFKEGSLISYPDKGDRWVLLSLNV